MRRASDSLEVMVGRIDARVEAIVDLLERQEGRIARNEMRLTVLESQRDRREGAQQERSRWVGVLSFAGQKVVPAGGGLAGIVALAHYWSGLSR